MELGETMNQKQGSCGCGAVKYSFSADKVNVINCHCNMCRSHNGAAFSSYVIAPANNFILDDPDNSLSSFTQENATKHFCSNCGTAVFNSNQQYQSLRFIYLGTIKDLQGVEPKLNVWSESRLDWLINLDNMKSFAQGSA